MNKIGFSLFNRKGSSTTNTTIPLLTQRQMSINNDERKTGQSQLSMICSATQTQPLIPGKTIVTVGSNAMKPVMSGMCLLDLLKDRPDFMTKVQLTFSKPMQ